MNSDNIFDWIQKNKATIHIEQGAYALKTIVDNGGLDVLMEVLHHEDGNEGLNGYFVEISINDDCAAWSYRDRLSDAIQDAYKTLCKFGVETGYIDPNTMDIIPTADAKSWLDVTKYCFVTNKVIYLE